MVAVAISLLDAMAAHGALQCLVLLEISAHQTNVRTLLATVSGIVTGQTSDDLEPQDSPIVRAHVMGGKMVHGF